jgi:hypothetical protein
MIEEKSHSRHIFICPAVKNVNADVVASDALTEHDFCNLEGFISSVDFSKKISTYQRIHDFTYKPIRSG